MTATETLLELQRAGAQRGVVTGVQFNSVFMRCHRRHVCTLLLLLLLLLVNQGTSEFAAQ